MNTFHRQQHDFPFPNHADGEELGLRSAGPDDRPADAGDCSGSAPGAGAAGRRPTPAEGSAGTGGGPARDAEPPPAGSVAVLSYLDVVLLVLGAPIMLLIGVSASGYLIGAGAWIVLRAAGALVDRALARTDPRTQISVRLGYMLGRLFLLALAVIVARESGGKDAGLAALAVIVFAFTIQLGISAVNRPRSR